MPLLLEPIDLKQHDLNALSSVLDGWINDAIASRKRMEEEWREDIRSYDATPKMRQKNWPWPGASNLEIPLKAIVSDAILARMHNAIYGHDQIWRAEVEDPDYVDRARSLEDFINFEARNRVQLKSRTKEWEFESILLGTGWLKGMWLDARRIVYLARQDQAPEPTEIFDHYGPFLDAVAIEDILVPAAAREVNGPFRCQFIDHVAELRWDELKEREQYGYRNLDRIKEDKYADWGITIKQERDRLAGIERLRRDGTFDVHEIWCNFPVYELDKYPNRKVRTSDGTIERDFVELVITYHARSRTVLRVIENWNEIGWRPFFPLRYMRRVGSVYGRGVGRMIHHLNDALNTVHNQRIDNATIANTRIWKARKGAFPRNTQITPSKVMWLDDPNGDLMPEQAGEVYPSSHQNEMILRDYIERRTGVVDYTLGKESPIGKYSATATSTLALLQEGSKKFDFTLDDWRDDFGAVAQWLLSQYRQHGYQYQGLLEREFGAQRAQDIREALEAQSDQPTFALYKFDLVATTAASSKDAQLQQNQILFDMTERFYIQLLQLIGMATRGVDEAGMPITPGQIQVIYEAVQAGVALFKRILHSFDVKDVENFLPNLQALEEASLNAGGQIPQAAPVAPPPAGLPGGPGAPRVTNGSAGPPVPSPVQ